MTWFSFASAGQSPKTYYPPVRRKIFFPSVTENLKVGDWIHVSLASVDIGKVYSKKNDGSIGFGFDDDSYIVVYETASTKTPTYSLIDDDDNLCFKSLTEVNSGSMPEGDYYIYYHADNVQYINLVGSTYVKTVNPGGVNYIATGSNAINYYSNIVKSDSTNTRIAAVSFLSGNGSWQNQKSNKPGDKVLGSFSGPNLKINADKTPDSGKIKITINKTSMTTTGQGIVTTRTVDLYSATSLTDQTIYTFDVRTLNMYSEYEDIYGSFSFEIEILNDKNISSTNQYFKITQYSFGKNYNLSLEKEEIYDQIIFSTTGTIK